MVGAGEWREVAIGDIADIVGGATPSTQDPDNFGGDIPWLTPKDLSGPHDRYIAQGARHLSQQGLDSCSAKLLPTGAVLLSTRAPVGYVAIAKNPIATNQGFRSLVVREGVSAEYLYYWLSAHTEELERHASGSTFRELSGSALKSIKLSLPPLGEQRRIAGVLGGLDDKIELNRRMGRTLEQVARALFRSWFVDFEPVRAKQAQRWSPGQSLPGLPAQLHPLFPDRLEPSPQGPIPQGWQVATLGDLCHKPQYGYTASAQDEPVGPKFLRIKDINKTSWIDWTTVPYCPIADEDIAKYQLEKGDIVIARMADPGHGALIEENRSAVFASYLIRFRPLDQVADRFLQYWLRSDAYWDLVAGRRTGTTRANLNAKTIAGFPLILPPRDVLISFRELISSLRSSVVENSTQSYTLESLRNRLLRQLIGHGTSS